MRLNSRKVCFTEEFWHKPSKSFLNQLPPTAFLDPARRKYPVMENPNGPIYVFALTASTAFAVATREMPFYYKAKRLLEIHHELKRRGIQCMSWRTYLSIWRS